MVFVSGRVPAVFVCRCVRAVFVCRRVQVVFVCRPVRAVFVSGCVRAVFLSGREFISGHVQTAACLPTCPNGSLSPDTLTRMCLGDVCLWTHPGVVHLLSCPGGVCLWTAQLQMRPGGVYVRTGVCIWMPLNGRSSLDVSEQCLFSDGLALDVSGRFWLQIYPGGVCLWAVFIV